MLIRNSLIGLAAVATFAIDARPALAQVSEGGQELDLYVGEMFGDDFTDRRIGGHRPELDNDVTYGLRYAFNFINGWGVELALGQNKTSATHLGGPDIDLDLTTFDVDAVYHFNASGRFVPYVLAGVGYSSADLDRPITAVLGGMPVRIEDDNGFTLNAGVGAKCFVSDRVLLRVDARYRYLDKVVDRFDDPLNTFETTFGVGFKF